LEQQTLYAYPFDELLSGADQLLNGADEQLMGLIALPLMASSNFKPATVKVEMYHEVLKN
jgi:hypothetical protein